MDTHQPDAPSDEALIAALECLLFMADRPLPPAELSEMLDCDPRRVSEAADRLTARYDGRGLQITRVAGGFQMCTRPEYAEIVAKLHEPHRFRLSRPALETLAIIAYRQPITRPEMEALRGVNCDSVVETLLERQLIHERGRRHTPGRPMTYGTTPEFLSQFGLDSLGDLPELPQVSAEEVEARLRAQSVEAESQPAQAEGAPPDSVESTPCAPAGPGPRPQTGVAEPAEPGDPSPAPQPASDDPSAT